MEKVMKNKLTVVYVNDLNGIDDYILAEYNYRHQFGITNETVVCFPTDVMSCKLIESRSKDLLNSMNDDNEKDYVLFTTSEIMLSCLYEMLDNVDIHIDHVVPLKHYLKRSITSSFENVEIDYDHSILEWNVYE
jgi:hypothetical protein